jgi:hypothetical protein
VGGTGYIVPIYNTTTLNGNSTSNDKTTSSKNTGSEPGLYAGIGVGVGIIVLIGVRLLVGWRNGWDIFRKKTALQTHSISVSSMVTKNRG